MITKAQTEKLIELIYKKNDNKNNISVTIKEPEYFHPQQPRTFANNVKIKNTSKDNKNN